MDSHKDRVAHPIGSARGAIKGRATFGLADVIAEHRSVKEIDQPSLKIGARKADSMALYLARTLKQAKLVEITESNGGEGVQALAAGDVDAFGSNRQRLSDTLRAAPGLRLLPDDLYGVEQTIIVPAGNTESLNTVNQFIDEVRRSGFLAASIARSEVVGIAVAGP